MDGVVWLFVFLPFLLITFPWLLLWAISAWRERAHMQSILLREEAFSYMHVTNVRTPPPGATHPVLVTGSVVVAADAWKTFLAGFRKVFGGRMHSLETVVERARREAVLRMLENASRLDANGVVNVRLDTASIGMGQALMVEVMASGTAIRMNQGGNHDTK